MSTLRKKIAVLFCCAVLTIAVGMGLFFWYLAYAFPAVRAQGTHLAVPDQFSDCISCHGKVTAQVAQDWSGSKHGVTLVKCVVCHGEPDGKGSVPFAAKPDPVLICARCHDPALQRMIVKYGEKANCNTCHPYHQNSMHGNAYEIRLPSTQTSF